jgi:hypothetical protein
MSKIEFLVPPSQLNHDSLLLLAGFPLLTSLHVRHNDDDDDALLFLPITFFHWVCPHFYFLYHISTSSADLTSVSFPSSSNVLQAAHVALLRFIRFNLKAQTCFGWLVVSISFYRSSSSVVFLHSSPTKQ